MSVPGNWEDLLKMSKHNCEMLTRAKTSREDYLLKLSLEFLEKDE